MNLESAFLIISNLIFFLQYNIPLLLVAWFFLLVLEWVWSGLEKAIRLFLFPGLLFYFLMKFLLLKRLGYELKLYHVFSAEFSSSKVVVRFNNPGKAALLIAILFVSTIITFFLFSNLLLFFSNFYAKLIIAWLSISIFLNGMPRKPDYYLLFIACMNTDLAVPLGHLLAIFLFALGTEIYGLLISIVLTILYVLVITIVAMTYPTRKEEYIISDEIISLEE